MDHLVKVMDIRVLYLFSEPQELYVDGHVNIPSGLIFSLMRWLAQSLISDRKALPLDQRNDLVVYLMRYASYTAQFLDCSDPRDRVLGLLGFLGPRDQNMLISRPDAPIAELYSRFIHLLLRGPPDKLAFGALDGASLTPNRYSLPTWCPDLHCIPPETLAKFTTTFQSSSKKHIAREGSSPALLYLSGDIVDHVATVVPDSWLNFVDLPLDRQETARVYANGSLIWLAACYHSFSRDGVDGRLVTGDLRYAEPARLEELCRTLLIFQKGFYEELTENLNEELEGIVSLWGELLDYLQNLVRGGEVLALNPGEFVLRFCHALNDFQGHRRFICTASGKYGLAPEKVQKGDLVCIFYGSSVPHIIRPGPEPGTHIMIGEVYVNGFMHGEAEDPTREPQEFLLV